MKHLIVSREYPPAPYAPGGIGTYVSNIAALMAERGETVHIIGQRWEGAPKELETTADGRLIVHRIAADGLPPEDDGAADGRLTAELEGLRRSNFPMQWFAWHAAVVAERLIEEDAIDVVEGQEWEAPLYFLLLRRALGLGPARKPPVIVHLHCPTEFARRFNGAPDTPREYVLMKRMENYCIRAADGLLCPSRYLARQVAAHFGFPPERIKVIPLPVGLTPFMERGAEVWQNGGICFVGRIEPRKGIIEWVDAAAKVAAEDPNVHFDFVGADIWAMQEQLIDQLPNSIRPRFRFHGSRPREELPGILAAARVAVVPSRWENFPNVCIEAMSTGLPVIATRFGGMAELIEDDETGWLCPDTGVAGMVESLATTLRRALAVSAERRAAMGRAAAEAVRRICDNETTVGEQIAYRAAIAERGAERSLALGLPAGGRPRPAPPATGREGFGIVLAVARLADARPVLASIRAQSRRPRALAVVTSIPPGERDGSLVERIKDDGGVVVHHPGERAADAWNAGFATLPKRDAVAFWLFLDDHDYLMEDCLARIEATMAHRPDVGLVSFWTEIADGSGAIEAWPCPALADQLTRNEAAPASGVRAEALDDPQPFRPGLPRDFDIWDLANQALAKGWLVATYPRILAQRDTPVPSVSWPQSTALRQVRAEVLSRLASALQPEIFDLIDLYVPIPRQDGGPKPPEEVRPAESAGDYLRIALFQPVRAARGVVRRGRVLVNRRRRRALRTSGTAS